MMKLFLVILIYAYEFSASIVAQRNTSRTLDPAFCKRLFTANDSRLRFGVDYVINIQNKTSMRKRNDVAKFPLFSQVNETLLGRPTFARLEDLFDNYIRHTGQAEHATHEEVGEMWRFIDAVMATEPMRVAYQYLVREGLASDDKRLFKRKLVMMWFHFYKRQVSWDSSGFEHVFVGELAKKRRGSLIVGGHHSWVQFYREERARVVNYEGYIKMKNSEPRILTIRYRVEGVEKPIGGFFIGTSPEFEMALYSMCFLKFPNGDCTCRMNEQDVKIKTFRSRGSRELVGTAYPIA